MKNRHNKLISSLYNKILLAMITNALAAMLGSIVDGIVISNFLGADKMAAFGLASPLLMIFSAIAAIMMAGLQTAATQSLGKGDSKSIKQLFSTMSFMCAAVGMAFLLIVCLLRNQLAFILGAGAVGSELNSTLSTYLLGFSLGLPGMFLSNMLGAALQIDNDSSRFIRGIAIATAINIGGDFLVAFVLPWGIFGVGVFTAISGYIGIAYQLIHFFRKKDLFSFDFRMISIRKFFSMFQSGLPTAVNRFSLTFSSYTINMILTASFATTAVTAYSIQNTVGLFLGCIAMGNGLAVLMLSSLFHAEKDIFSLKEVLISAGKKLLFIIVPVAALVFIAAPYITLLFGGGNNPDVKQLGTAAIRFFAIGLPFTGILEIYKNYFQGINRLLAANLISVASNIILIPGLAFLLSRWIGLNGIWMAFPIGYAAAVIILGLMLLRETIKNRQLLLGLLCIDQSFVIPDENQLELTVTSMSEVVAASEQAAMLCKTNKVPQRESMLIALYIEEMAGNIIKHGFNGSQKYHMDIKLVISRESDKITLIMRDDCRPFDPLKYLEILNSDNKDSGFGIRIVTKLADSIAYRRTVNMNHLTITVRI